MLSVDVASFYDGLKTVDHITRSADWHGNSIARVRNRRWRKQSAGNVNVNVNVETQPGGKVEVAELVIRED